MIALLWALAASAQPLDLNLATEAELALVPGLGPVRAEAIVAWRAAHGPFTSVEGLVVVPGVSEVSLRIAHGALSASAILPPSPWTFDPNTAQEGELLALPGIGPRQATAILRSRDALGRFERCEELERVAELGRAAMLALLPLCALRVDQGAEQL